MSSAPTSPKTSLPKQPQWVSFRKSPKAAVPARAAAASDAAADVRPAWRATPHVKDPFPKRPPASKASVSPAPSSKPKSAVPLEPNAPASKHPQQPRSPVVLSGASAPAAKHQQRSHSPPRSAGASLDPPRCKQAISPITPPSRATKAVQSPCSTRKSAIESSKGNTSAPIAKKGRPAGGSVRKTLTFQERSSQLPTGADEGSPQKSGHLTKIGAGAAGTSSAVPAAEAAAFADSTQGQSTSVDSRRTAVAVEVQQLPAAHVEVDPWQGPKKDASTLHDAVANHNDGHLDELDKLQQHGSAGANPQSEDAGGNCALSCMRSSLEASFESGSLGAEGQYTCSHSSNAPCFNTAVKGIPTDVFLEAELGDVYEHELLRLRALRESQGKSELHAIQDEPGIAELQESLQREAEAGRAADTQAPEEVGALHNDINGGAPHSFDGDLLQGPPPSLEGGAFDLSGEALDDKLYMVDDDQRECPLSFGLQDQNGDAACPGNQEDRAGLGISASEQGDLPVPVEVGLHCHSLDTECSNVDAADAKHDIVVDSQSSPSPTCAGAPDDVLDAAWSAFSETACGEAGIVDNGQVDSPRLDGARLQDEGPDAYPCRDFHRSGSELGVVEAEPACVPSQDAVGLPPQSSDGEGGVCSQDEVCIISCMDDPETGGADACETLAEDVRLLEELGVIGSVQADMLVPGDAILHCQSLDSECRGFDTGDAVDDQVCPSSTDAGGPPDHALDADRSVFDENGEGSSIADGGQVDSPWLDADSCLVFDRSGSELGVVEAEQACVPSLDAAGLPPQSLHGECDPFGQDDAELEVCSSVCNDDAERGVADAGQALANEARLSEELGSIEDERAELPLLGGVGRHCQSLDFECSGFDSGIVDDGQGDSSWLDALQDQLPDAHSCGDFNQSGSELGAVEAEHASVPSPGAIGLPSQGLDFECDVCVQNGAGVEFCNISCRDDASENFADEGRLPEEVDILDDEQVDLPLPVDARPKCHSLDYECSVFDEADAKAGKVFDDQACPSPTDAGAPDHGLDAEPSVFDENCEGLGIVEEGQNDSLWPDLAEVEDQGPDADSCRVVERSDSELGDVEAEQACVPSPDAVGLPPQSLDVECDVCGQDYVELELCNGFCGVHASETCADEARLSEEFGIIGHEQVDLPLAVDAGPHCHSLDYECSALDEADAKPGMVVDDQVCPSPNTGAPDHVLDADRCVVNENGEGLGIVEDGQVDSPGPDFVGLQDETPDADRCRAKNACVPSPHIVGPLPQSLDGECHAFGQDDAGLEFCSAFCGDDNETGSVDAGQAFADEARPSEELGIIEDERVELPVHGDAGPHCPSLGSECSGFDEADDDDDQVCLSLTKSDAPPDLDAERSAFNESGRGSDIMEDVQIDSPGPELAGLQDQGPESGGACSLDQGPASGHDVMVEILGDDSPTLDDIRFSEQTLDVHGEAFKTDDVELGVADYQQVGLPSLGAVGLPEQNADAERSASAEDGAELGIVNDDHFNPCAPEDVSSTGNSLDPDCGAFDAVYSEPGGFDHDQVDLSAPDDAGQAHRNLDADGSVFDEDKVDLGMMDDGQGDGPAPDDVGTQGWIWNAEVSESYGNYDGIGAIEIHENDAPVLDDVGLPEHHLDANCNFSTETNARLTSIDEGHVALPVPHDVGPQYQGLDATDGAFDLADAEHGTPDRASACEATSGNIGAQGESSDADCSAFDENAPELGMIDDCQGGLPSPDNTGLQDQCLDTAGGVFGQDESELCSMDDERALLPCADESGPPHHDSVEESFDAAALDDLGDEDDHTVNQTEDIGAAEGIPGAAASHMPGAGAMSEPRPFNLEASILDEECSHEFKDEARPSDAFVGGQEEGASALREERLRQMLAHSLGTSLRNGSLAAALASGAGSKAVRAVGGNGTAATAATRRSTPRSRVSRAAAAVARLAVRAAAVAAAGVALLTLAAELAYHAGPPPGFIVDED